MSRIKQARRPPTIVIRVHDAFVAQPLLAVRLFCQFLTYPSRPQQIPMLPYLLANRFHIRRKPAAGHDSRMKITVGTLRLAERHLHVNPKLPHRTKTLAHPRLNSGKSNPWKRNPTTKPLRQRNKNSEIPAWLFRSRPVGLSHYLPRAWAGT